MKKSFIINLAIFALLLGGCSFNYIKNHTEVSDKFEKSTDLEYACNYWSQTYLRDNPDILESLKKFDDNELCLELKEIVKGLGDRHALEDKAVLTKLQSSGYDCSTAPLRVTPDLNDKRYLKKDGTITYDEYSPNNALQTTCIKDRCSVRIKHDGLPNGLRRNGHITLAILRKKNDPSYSNEIAKISIDEQGLPPGPTPTAGLTECPYANKLECKHWVDDIMDKVHIPLSNR